MATTAFPIRQTEDGVGCTDSSMRHILGALYQNKGIVDGLDVSGSGLNYTVASGVAVCSRGDSDGKTIGYFEGGTVASSANAGDLPRIDVIWICAHDATQGDDDNLMTLGCTQGTAAASPTEPSIPSYATKLQGMLVPAGATTLASATAIGDIDYVIPYGANLGVLFDKTYTKNADVTVNKQFTAVSGTITLPTARTVNMHVTLTMRGSGTYGGSIYVLPYIDGVNVNTFEVALSPYNYATSENLTFAFEIPKGTHTIRFDLLSKTISTVHMYYSSTWAGQRFQLVDVGPVG